MLKWILVLSFKPKLNNRAKEISREIQLHLPVYAAKKDKQINVRGKFVSKTATINIIQHYPPPPSPQQRSVGLHTWALFVISSTLFIKLTTPPTRVAKNLQNLKT